MYHMHVSYAVLDTNFVYIWEICLIKIDFGRTSTNIGGEMANG